MNSYALLVHGGLILYIHMYTLMYKFLNTTIKGRLRNAKTHIFTCNSGNLFFNILIYAHNVPKVYIWTIVVCVPIQTIRIY